MRVYKKGSEWGADKKRGCAGSQVVHLLILMSFSGPFNLASGGFLATPPLIANCSHLPFGTQGRSWRLESCLQETGPKGPACPGFPQGPTRFQDKPGASPPLSSRGAGWGLGRDPVQLSGTWNTAVSLPRRCCWEPTQGGPSRAGAGSLPPVRSSLCRRALEET